MEGAPTGPVVTVAVVSWNTRELLLRCLRSLAGEVHAGRAQVWVVDNGSEDGSAQAARESAPWAQVIESEGNLGFGRAVNLVAERTATPWLACANADVVLEPGALIALIRAGADHSVGCVAPRLLLEDGTTQHSVYPLPTLRFTIAFNLGLPAVSRSLGDRLCLEGRWNAERPRAVPWAIGALLLLRREAFTAVGGFDPRQWMYAEDLDLGWRLDAAGWVTRYEPSARVQHAGGAATAIAFGDKRIERFMHETYAVILRRCGRRRTCAIAAINVLGTGARVAWMTPLAWLLRRWRGPRDDCRRWLVVHRRGFRQAKAARSCR